MIPEIILGMVLMAFFYMMNLPFGMLTLLIGHTVFCVPYILMEVKARLAGMDPSLEEAARDLGAGQWSETVHPADQGVHTDKDRCYAGGQCSLHDHAGVYAVDPSGL